jgi:8-oxo-dGTP pyrophosphatase MutT (NUDIX family)
VVAVAVEERYSVRAILLTPDEHVLLMRIRDPESNRRFWITPGGGLEPSEGVEQGPRRELREEVGLESFELGPVVWRRHHTFNWAQRRISQEEEYRIVRVERFEPQMSDLAEAAVLDRFRWWRLGDLEHCEERLTPLSLATIISDYLRHGAPMGPLTVERLID